MTKLNEMADGLNRTVKVALDTGEVASVEEAERLFSGYRLQILVGPDVADSPSLQAALLTAVNCAARTLLGGVTVVGAQGQLRVSLPSFHDLASATTGLGGRPVSVIDPVIPTLIIGDVETKSLEPLALRVIVSGWCGGVAPATKNLELDAGPCVTTAGVLAGAVAVSEVFQRLRGNNPMACRRSVGLSLWRPSQDWLSAEHGPPVDRLPMSAWLVGMGNLGQAYLWTLGFLPYGDQAVELVLQDLDVLAPSNLSTSLLTTPALLGRKKTRALADWSERRGFRTAIVERSFAPDFKVSAREPIVALIGVDNALARQAVEDVGFDRVIEAGLGRGPKDFLGLDLHTFPASKPARQVWRETAVADADIAQPAYRALLEQTGDRCGTVRLAGRSIGAPFVGAVAAALVIAELIRLVMGDRRYEIVSCHLRDLGARLVVKGEPWPPSNPGFLPLAA
ncbi:MAG: hypothetical protein OXC14_08140 [Rhodospirillaceae bacterium]|nr:hypothetical protein [Rhodospirillaceae bacterium]